MRMRKIVVTSVVLWGSMIWIGCVASVSGAERSDLTASEKLLFKNWVAQLSDSSRYPKTKIEAAEALLTRDYSEAEKVLRDFLSNKTNTDF